MLVSENVVTFATLCYILVTLVFGFVVLLRYFGIYHQCGIYLDWPVSLPHVRRAKRCCAGGSLIIQNLDTARQGRLVYTYMLQYLFSCLRKMLTAWQLVTFIWMLARSLLTIILENAKFCLPLSVLPKKNISREVALITGAGKFGTRSLIVSLITDSAGERYLVLQ